MDYRLALDVGVTSLGWAILEIKDGKAARIKDMGSHIFSDGRVRKTHEPLSVARRGARGSSRRLDRLKQRKDSLMHILIDAGLMPKDEENRRKLKGKNPYELRSRGVSETLKPYELGRALFHICQRRGFKSNRKSDKKEKDSSEMKKSITALHQKIADKGAKTLGQYLYITSQESTHPELRVKTTVVKGKNNYNFYPDRALYEQEVRLLLETQKVPKELSERIFHAIFFQRPLRETEVGFCMFEENERRVPKAYPIFQKFRLLQTLNQLEFAENANGEKLSDEQRKKIKNLLENAKEIKFDRIRKTLKVAYEFNLESDRRKFLEGDETAALLGNKKAFGDKWFSLSGDEQENIIDCILQAEDQEDIADGLKFYNLSDDQIDDIFKINLPDGYSSLSKKAMLKILPFLEEGMMYDKACKAAGYHHSVFDTKERETLPYYAEVLTKEVMGGTFEEKDKDFPEKYFGKIANPTVHISLNQIRRLVNAVISLYGKPSEIVVEVARDLKAGQEKRREILTEQAKNQKDNEKTNKKLEELGVKQSYDNRMIYKLWEDLSDDVTKRMCPFCGKQVSIERLYSGEFEVEHLVPFSRCFNDKRSNKVISCKACNRHKRNKTPFEAFGHHPETWDAILARAERLPKNKRWRFSKDVMEKIGDQDMLLARFLNDTRYISLMTKKYLACICPQDNIRTVPGQLTSLMRHAWGLNTVLSEEDQKNRGDHRHHAIDAFTIGCIDRATLQKVSQNSEKQWKEKQKLAAEMDPPFPNFKHADFEYIVQNMVVSYKPDHHDVQNAIRHGKTIGKLHEETNYGLIREGERTGKSVFAHRKLLTDLFEEKHIEEIADKSIRARLLSELDGITDQTERKRIVSDFGHKNNIKTVRLHIERNMDVMRGIKKKEKDAPYRYVATGGNYCIEIYQPNRGKYKDKWQAEVISIFDAHQKDFVPEWRKKEPEAKRIMRLFIDDMVAYEKDGKTVICRVKKITSPDRVYLRPHTIAKEEADKESWAAAPEPLRKVNARRVSVDILGRVKDPMKTKKA